MTDQPAQPVTPLTAEQDKQWASFAHLGGILSFLPSLIIYLVFKDRAAFTRQESQEALNFQLTLLIINVAWFIITLVLTVVTFGILGFLGNLSWIVWIVGVIFSILGFMSAKDGVAYRYPFALRMIK
ncbi:MULTISPECIES: DUF4870 domain-containing protein [unclassified Diaminobutyricimonas]|uniref:DUF4870 domain-containing protein n=1 Tax=unclassified Diaminobutyricimonas TaxID=2643261 RepID=UPI0012F523E5|nr:MULTISPECIES: DUF4870 domain-containing protein [unclassified Diaminobutyricimonas]